VVVASAIVVWRIVVVAATPSTVPRPITLGIARSTAILVDARFL
jgi:hypothetical protein